jgi:hypothetical protein
MKHFQSNYFRNVQKNHHLMLGRGCLMARSAFCRSCGRRLALIKWNDSMLPVAGKFVSCAAKPGVSAMRDSVPVDECGGVAAAPGGGADCRCPAMRWRLCGARG